MKKIGLVVGHKPTAKGAGNKAKGMYEFDFNNKLASIIAECLISKGYDPIIIYRDTYSGLPNKVNNIAPDIAISLHCNAFNGRASGAEVLYHHSSSNGAKLAKVLQTEIVKVMSESDRGIKPIDYDHKGNQGDRGGWLVEKTSMPVVIAEPFFIDNLASLNKALTRMKFLAEAYAVAVDNYFKE